MKRHQPEVRAQKGRTLHHHRRPIPDYLSPLPPTDLEDPPSVPRFSLIALSRKHCTRPELPETTT